MNPLNLFKITTIINMATAMALTAKTFQSDATPATAFSAIVMLAFVSLSIAIVYNTTEVK